MAGRGAVLRSAGYMVWTRRRCGNKVSVSRLYLILLNRRPSAIRLIRVVLFQFSSGNNYTRNHLTVRSWLWPKAVVRVEQRWFLLIVAPIGGSWNNIGFLKMKWFQPAAVADGVSHSGNHMLSYSLTFIYFLFPSFKFSSSTPNFYVLLVNSLLNDEIQISIIHRLP